MRTKTAPAADLDALLAPAAELDPAWAAWLHRLLAEGVQVGKKRAAEVLRSSAAGKKEGSASPRCASPEVPTS
jgi:hypothetical protein